jgi:hypothetical protein
MDSVKDSTTCLYRETAISWVLHAIKIVLGYEDVRRDILKEFHPKIRNIEYYRMFDGDPESDRTPGLEKYKEIQEHLMESLNRQPYILFTACNMKDPDTGETHYQSFYMNNKRREIYVIDPAKPKKGYGIYYPEVAILVVRNFAKANGYAFRFLGSTCPAQTSLDDVFCQSWTMYMLLHGLEFGFENPVQMPKLQFDKYNVLLSFYKEILKKIPSTVEDLRTTYYEELLSEENKNIVLSEGTLEDWYTLCSMDPYELVLKMTAQDMA